MVANPNMLSRAPETSNKIDFSKVIWQGSEMEARKEQIEEILANMSHKDDITLEEAKAGAENGNEYLMHITPAETLNTDSVVDFDKVQSDAVKASNNKELEDEILASLEKAA